MKLLLKLTAFFIIFISLALIIFLIWASSGLPGKYRLSGLKTIHGSINDLAKKQTFKILTYNCGYFSGMRNNLPIRSSKNFFLNNLDIFVDLLRKLAPDIICFQEMDFNSHRSYEIEQLDYISGNLNYKYGAFAVNWNKKYIPFPYWPPSVHFKKMFSGQSVLSMYPVIKNKRIVLKRPKNPFYYNMFYLNRLIQETKVKIGENLLIIMNIHLEAFDKSAREEQAEFVLEYYRKNFKNKFPVIILGDFNCVPPDSDKKNNFSDEPETDYREEKTIRLFLNEKSLYEALPGNKKNLNTFPSVNPDRKLDYIFYSKDKIEMINASIYEIHSSDHLPVMLNFRFK